MDKGRRGHDQLPRTMGRPGPMMTLLLLCITFLTMQSVSDTTKVSSRLPTQICMTAIVANDQKPLNMDYLYFSWEHEGRLLVEFKDNNVTNYEPRALLPQGQLQDGNVSLILINLTVSDTGNYTCLINYQGLKWRILYMLNVEKHRIQLFNLSSKKVEENIEKSVHRLVKLLNRPVKKYARQSSAHKKIWGYSPVTARPGDNVTLVCRFSMEPSMELNMLDIRWSKDGVTKYVYNNASQEEDSARLEELSRGFANLNLTSVQKEDSGNYVCDINYRIWQKNITILLIVKNDKVDSRYRQEELKTFVTEKPARQSSAHKKIWGYSPVTARPGDNVTLVCRFSMEPSMELNMLDIRWSKDGVTKYVYNNASQEEDSARLEELSRGLANLNLTSVQKEDSGNYVCDINYRIWQKNITIFLFVKEPKEEFRKAKIGMVVGAVAGVNFLAFIVFFFVAG